MKTIFSVFLILFSLQLSAQTKVAVVKVLRGEVDILTLGKTTRLKVDDWVEDGAVIRTAEKSFVKLVFVDKSQMNVGPSSEMKIEAFSGKDSGVIDLVKGKIRSQVTKDYLQMKEKDKSKLFIKTANAVMGVRGTDFMISTNGASTSAFLFEGEVVFNKLQERGEATSAQLEEIVNRGVRMFPGEFSVMDRERSMPTVPALLNIQQREHLEKNKEFDSTRSPSNSGNEVSKSVVPAGLNGVVVANNTEILHKEVSQVTSTAKEHLPASKDPQGYVNGEIVKPANGSFVHVDSGVIIPPGPTSVLDKNTNTYIPGPESGKVTTDGTYVPPKNVEITDGGKIFVAVSDASGSMKVQEVQKPVPIIGQNHVSLGQIPQVIQGNPGMLPPPGGIITNDILNTSFAPNGLNDLSNQRLNQTGGFTSVTDPTRLNSTKVDTTIVVQPSP